jgi:hypothetical protein
MERDLMIANLTSDHYEKRLVAMTRLEPSGETSFSAIADNAEPAFQFALTKFGDSNRAVFPDP